MNILITGARGQLGSSIKKLQPQSKHAYFFADLEDLDITDCEAVREYIFKHHIEVIINCAAYTNVDKAEIEKEGAYSLNAYALQNLIDALKVNNGRIIHISTDYVFGEPKNKHPFTENDEVNPINVYGKSKHQGEEIIRRSGLDYIIIRTAWLYSEFGQNFVKKIISLLQTQNSIKVVFDQIGTPTYAGDLAKCIIQILDKEDFESHIGTYHFTNEGVCSWYDFAQEIKRLIGNQTTHINPCRSFEFPTPAKRPCFSVLDKSKIKKEFNLIIPYWVDSLSKCISNLDLD